MRSPHSIHILTTVAAMLLIAGQASGAQVTRISWDVTGGTFDGPEVMGAITGGSLVFTPAAPLSTPVVSSTTGAVTLTLNGPGGSFSVMIATSAFAIRSITVGPNNAHGYFLGQSVAAHSGSQARFHYALSVTFNAANGLSFGHVAFGIPGYALGSHNFNIGNEVRTEAVPEPGTASLLALGLTGLGLAGAGRRGAVHWLERRRG